MSNEELAAAAGEKMAYAITFTQDFGGGRQLQVALGLKPGATQEAFDSELDKVRKAISRQQAFGILRDTEAKLGAERKMLAAIESMIEESDKTAEKTLRDLDAAPKNMQTVVKQQNLNKLEQARSFRQSKVIEKQQHETNIAIAESIIEGAKKEIEG